MRRVLISLLGLVLIFMAACDGYGKYFAEVDRVEPDIPGLIVQEYPAVTGAIEIVNDTGQDVYILNEQGREIFKITTTEVLKKEHDQWRHYYSGNVASLGYEVGIDYDAHENPPGKRGQVMKEWVVRGRVGDVPFAIYGKTVCRKP